MAEVGVVVGEVTVVAGDRERGLVQVFGDAVGAHGEMLAQRVEEGSAGSGTLGTEWRTACHYYGREGFRAL